jgi:serine/threonine protein kinase
MPSLIQTLLSSLLDSPIVESAKEGAISTIKTHFTFSAQQISTAYQDSYGYTLVAISVGVATPDQNLAQKIFNSKISREFAEQIDRHYLQPFAKQYGLSSQDLPAFRLTAAQSLKDFAKHKDKISPFEQITDDDLMALISYRDTAAITDLILTQMQGITPVDDTLAAFLRHDGQLGDGVLFFFRELIRKDDRLEKTQAALQRQGLSLSVPNLQTALKSAEDNLNRAIQEKSSDLVKIAQQLQDLQQTQTAWQSHHEQLIRFSRRFENRLAEMLEWAKDVYSTLGVLEKLTEMMAYQGLSSQIKARDELTIHNSTSLQLIRDAAEQLKQLPPQNPEYSQMSIMVGSALSSAGDLEQAEHSFRMVIENAQKDTDKALAYFNLFQILLRRKAYTEALENLQAAIAIEPERYALHDIRKYPLEKLLGAGGMGCVFLCRNDNQKRVVVKCFWETLEEGLKEPFAMHDIAGDYIPEPLELGYVQERAYFVTEYIDGAIDGEKWLEKYGTMDLKTGLAVGLKIAQGLQIAHEAGIYHLDLKPANILLLKNTPDVSVKIINFGLSQVTRTEVAVLGSRARATLLGQMTFGTYAPPEGLSQYGKPQSDVFSFGATMYRLWTGESPRYFRERELPAVSQLRDLLFDCVKTDPKQRPESARELVSRLKAIYESQEAEQRRKARRKREIELAMQRAEEARKIKEDEKAWQQACQSDNKSAYQGYLNGYTLYAEEAKKRLQAIEEEELAKRLADEEEAKKRAIEPEELAKKPQAESREQPRRDEKPSFFKKLGFTLGVTSRYTDNGDGTVTDNKTGLIWLKKANCSARRMTWKEAMQWAAKLAQGQCGLSDDSKAGDWRLPTREEWEAMVDDKYKKPALSNAVGTDQWKEGDVFSGVQYWYWSSTENSTSSAWFVNLYDGDVNHNDDTNKLYVWAVRGGH